MSQYDNDTTVGATTWAGGQVPVSLYERARQTMLDQGLAWDGTLTEALNLWLEKKAMSGAGKLPSTNDIPASVSSTLAARRSVESLLESSFPPEFFRRVKALADSRLIPCVSVVRVGLELWCLSNEHKDIFTETLHKVDRARRAARAQPTPETSPGVFVEG